MTSSLARLCVFTACLAGGAVGCRSESHAAPSIPLTRCHLTGKGARVVDAMCGTLSVPEDRAAPGGRRIELSVAVVPATGRRPAADAMFVLAGGPGQSAEDVYPMMADAFARMNLKRDIVLVDQRGTGRSGALECPKTELDGTLESEEESAAHAAECEAELAKRADLRMYTTAIAMDDLDDARQALGYDKIDLYGGSYGTRAALVYLRRHESHTRAVVLDGVAPPDWPVGEDFGRDGQRTMNAIFARCGASTDCARAFPDLPGSLSTLLGAHEKPTRLTVTHPTTAAQKDVLVSSETLAGTLHALSYESETAALIPLLVHDAAATGNVERLAVQSLILSDAMKVSVGMHLAVMCSEDVPFFDLAKINADAPATYLGAMATRRYLDACKAWPRATITPADRAPVSSSVPVLLLSGEDDPVTPPENAARAAATLANSRQITIPGEGHGALMRGCTRRIVADFVERASASDLATECLADSKPAPFFTTFAGPPP
jgi:pimeloyl-ACP methyl ester carboxylesterase